MLPDVRAPSEFDAYHIEGAVPIPLPELRTRFVELPRDLPIVTVCSTGIRASMASSLLKAQGFAQVCNLAGGMSAIEAAGLGPECPVCIGPHGPHQAV